jgi:hemerythrin-like metal-binding protein
VPIEWTPELSVGDAKVDDDHQKLLSHVNVFLEAMLAARGAAALAPLFEFLNDFMRRHFAAEEQLMREGRYPGLPAHQAEHRQFLQALDRHYEQYKRTGPSATIVTGLGESLGKNLREHMCQSDRALCEFLQDGDGDASG